MLNLLCKSRLTGVLFTLLLLSGCALSPSPPPQERPCGQWDSQIPKAKALQRWTIAGKVNLRTPQQNNTASFDWQQENPRHYRMMISGPFGIGRNSLEQNNDHAVLTNGNGTFQASSPEGLMQQQLGWALPISSLYYWARGLPAPDQPYRMTPDACGYPEILEQQGWRINYSQWVFAGGYWLPSRMKMHYEQLNTTLLLKEWHPNRFNQE